MSSSKMNSITDPLAQQKTAAANIGLNNYQSASANVPSLQGYYNQNFGQSQGQTLAGMNPMFQDIYNSVQGDVSGTGGPFADLKKNLLGSFDTGQTQASQQLQQQMQAQGLGGTGAGMALMGNEGVNAAQQRALLGANTDVNMLNMADELSQQLTQQNQQQGFTNPMTALNTISGLSSPPNFQSPETSYYTPGNSTGNILGDVASALAVGATPFTGGSSLLALPGTLSMAAANNGPTMMGGSSGGGSSDNGMSSSYYGPMIAQIMQYLKNNQQTMAPGASMDGPLG